MPQNHGTVWWSELGTRDVEGAKSYYAKACGWTYDSMEMPDGGDYFIAKNGDMPAAGILDLNRVEGVDGVPPHWFTYIAVADIEAAVECTRSEGGQIRREPWEVPNVGKIAIVVDPTGAHLGFVEPPAQQAAG